MKLTEFIHREPDWEQILASPPYSVRTKRKGRYVLLRYNQYDSDFTLEIVRECRGVILDEQENYKPVCVPFYKFGNYGETYVPDIEWSTARVQEKIDGSIIKLWYHNGEWHTSSNGEIDARSAVAQGAWSGEKSNVTLFDLFWDAWSRTGVSLSSLDTNFTFMFELTSPFNRIVVRYPETEIWHIGTRDNGTLQECHIDIGIKKPAEYPLQTLEDVITAAKSLEDNREGFVVVDGKYNRVKVKSPRYVVLAHLLAGVSTDRNLLELILKGEKSEFLTYFPEYEPDVLRMESKYASLINRLEDEAALVFSTAYENRKEMAAVITKQAHAAFLFSYADGKAKTADEWLRSRPVDAVLRML